MPSTTFSKPLNKQVAQNAADIAAINTNLANSNGAIAIVATGNTAPKAISKGQFVYWNGGLCTATSNIASGSTLSSSNLQTIPDGGLNELNGDLASQFPNQVMSSFANLSEFTTYLDNVLTNAKNRTVIGLGYLNHTNAAQNIGLLHGGGLVLFGHPTSISLATAVCYCTTPSTIAMSVLYKDSGTWGTSWKIVRDIRDNYYNPGDTYSVADAMCAGFVTSSATEMHFSFFIPKRIASGTNVTLTSLKGTVRGTKGYVDLAASNTFDFINESSYTITAAYKNNNYIHVIVKKSSALTNVDNNTPISGWFTAVGFSFT